MGRLVVAPLTRIEGHARVTIALDEHDQVRDARVEGLELRGFEAICVGRPIREMPALTSRICGICPVAHSLAAARAGDAIVGAAPPPAATALRRLILVASLLQSHATYLFYLAAPDLVFGAAAPAELRNAFAVAREAPRLADDGVLLRRFAQDVVERVGGRRVHPAFAIPGGVTQPLAGRARDELAAALPQAFAAAERTFAWWAERAARTPERSSTDETWLLAHASRDGALALTDAPLWIASPQGNRIEGPLPAEECLRRMTGRSVAWSRARLWTLETARGCRRYRVGPLARLTVAARCGTARADGALAALRDRGGGAVRARDVHGAVLVEMLHALERVGELLGDPVILSSDVLAPAGAPRREGVGACEAPRGTLFHRYEVDEHGLVTSAGIVTPTEQNLRALNAAVRQASATALRGPRIDAGLRTSVSQAVRSFDPCLSCATHADGTPALALRLVAATGEVADEWPRE